MVLQTKDVRRARDVAAFGSARLVPILEVFALKNETLIQCLGDLLELAVILVIAITFVRQHRMHRVMEIVAPHCVITKPSALRRTNQLRVIRVRLCNDADFTPKLSPKVMHAQRKLLQYVWT